MTNFSNDDRTVARTADETPTVQLVSLPGEALTPGAILGGRYRIVSLLGRGGMGEVYRADDLRLNQPVALKFLARQTAIDERQLHEEVRIGRQVSHPNVCRLYDIEEVDGRIFIAMEYVDGEDLAALLRRVGRLAPDRALSVARDLCAGLAAAHELGVIHRDLKPGNVLIDGRGRARVTDFGLAVEHDAAHVSAGTPAYMAPEQLAGHQATVRSDLYSLALVLYEVFTGKRAIEATSLGEIARQQREQKFLRPSAIVPDIDPVVEEAILRCLDPDPAARPASVHELVRELPGFDPIVAALAAGETPSAGLIAASAQKGDLTPRAAWSLLILTLSGLLLAAAVAPVAMLVSGTTAKPPDVLLERAREVLTAAGVTRAAVDRGFNYERNDEHVELHRGRTAFSTPVEFFYRESPTPMRPSNLQRRLTPSSPPVIVEGMTLVRLDATGRLLEFARIPPRRDEAPVTTYDWTKLLALARIEPASLRPVPSEWTGRSDSDAKHAWTIGRSTLRVEAASLRGRPVWFAVIEPMQVGPGVAQSTRMDFQLARLVEMTLLIVLPTAVLFIAWTNYRRGRTDRRGAVRLGLFFFAALTGGTLLRMHHPAGFREEWLQVSDLVAEVAWVSFTIGIAYVAVEPLVRKRWPQMLIAWSRLLTGRWRDAMVGRDILTGALFGTGIALAHRLTAIAPRWFGIDTTPLADVATPLGSIRQVGWFLVQGLLESIYSCVFAVVLVLLLRAVLRRLDAAIAVSMLLLTGYYVAQATGPLPARIAYAAFVATMVYGVLFRYGLLALVSTGYVATVLFKVPLTLDTSSWYFPRAALVLLVLGALACFGFYVSLAGKRWLPRLSM